MEVATGAMGSLLCKLGELLKEEYNLQRSVKKDIKFLSRELPMMHAALCMVGEVPLDQLDDQVKIWAREVRELSYDMEDIADTFKVHIEQGFEQTDLGCSEGFIRKMVNLFKKGRSRHQIANEIKDIKDRVKEVAERRDRYKVESIFASYTQATATIDPRLTALFKKVTELIGINGARDMLIRRLSKGAGAFEEKLKIVSIVGVGGLGKTTLAKAVYDMLVLGEQFDCCAFAPLVRNPDMKRFFKDILLELDKHKYMHITAVTLDERQLINELLEFLDKKRYLIVIDDIWETPTWDLIKNALPDSNCGSRIITTTRISKVAEKVGDIYNIQPLSDDNAEKLFYNRIFGFDGKYPSNQLTEVSKKILKKCGGIPLSIITIASLLASKPNNEWSKVYDSIGFGQEDSKDVRNTRKILSFSYYDLPIQLRTCLLHLTIFPEDYWIEKYQLIWRWIAEGFVHEEKGLVLFEQGERFLDELINRSLIQPTDHCCSGIIEGYRVHDMVLDLIRSLSSEENFCTVLDKEQDMLSQSNNVRRLAIHKRILEHNPEMNVRMAQVRSFNAYMCGHMDCMPLWSFKVVRVLVLDLCNFTGSTHLEPIGKLLHLKYLGLVNTTIAELPKEVGNLMLLQTLDIWLTGIEELPSTIGKLKRLICLRADSNTRVPAGVIGSLTSLQQLRLHSADKSPSAVVELGKLVELRVLEIHFCKMDQNSRRSLVESMCNLRNIQVLEVHYDHSGPAEWAYLGSSWEGWVPHPRLRQFLLRAISLPRLPLWINSSHVAHLSYLQLGVGFIDVQNLQTIGRLPALRYLYISSRIPLSYVVAGGDGLFQNLRHCTTNLEFMFQQGAMPMLVHLEFRVNVLGHLGRREDPAGLGLGHLPFLEVVILYLQCSNASIVEVAEVEAVLRSEVHVHPNHPTLNLEKYHCQGQQVCTYYTYR
uniref:NB-ARC domain-containing protein n=1 Tax=Oryza barthii TaxID=65489 RepID=A0A0D3HQ57_9ORYZ